MTLIARVRQGTTAVYFGDVLLSNTIRPALPVSIPALSDVNARPAPRIDRFVSGMVQKINIFSNNLILAFAGDTLQARAMARDLVLALEAGMSTSDEAIEIMSGVEMRDRNNLSIIGAIVAPGPEITTVGEFRYGCRQLTAGPASNTSEFHIDTAGTGANAFERYLPTMLKIIGKNAPLAPAGRHDQPLIVSAISMLTQLVGVDLATGNNLASFYGGAFEIATLSSGGFKKIDRVMHTRWFLKKLATGRFELQLIPRIVHYRYVSATLVISVMEVIDSEEYLQVHYVQPLFAGTLVTHADIDFSYETLTAHVQFEERLGGGDFLTDHSQQNDLFTVVRDSSGTRMEIAATYVEELRNHLSQRYGVDVV